MLLSREERIMLPKISLPPPTISMRTAVMLMQTQVSAAKRAPDTQAVVAERSRAAKGMDRLLHYARTAQALATRTAPSQPGEGGGATTIMPTSGIDAAQANALLALGVAHVGHLSPPRMPQAMVMVGEGADLRHQTDAGYPTGKADAPLRR